MMFVLSSLLVIKVNDHNNEGFTLVLKFTLLYSSIANVNFGISLLRPSHRILYKMFGLRLVLLFYNLFFLDCLSLSLSVTVQTVSNYKIISGHLGFKSTDQRRDENTESFLIELSLCYGW